MTGVFAQHLTLATTVTSVGKDQLLKHTNKKQYVHSRQNAPETVNTKEASALVTQISLGLNVKNVKIAYMLTQTAEGTP